MDIKCSVSFTGSFTRDNHDDAIESLTPMFFDLKAEDIRGLIEREAIIKKSISLELANKIKTKFEISGVECRISVDQPEVVESLPKALPIPSQSTMPVAASIPELALAKKEGALIIAVAVILSFALLFISNGYDPRGGLLWSINETMTVYDGYPFGCKEVVYAPGSGHPTSYGTLGGEPISGGCGESLEITIKTKYILLFLLVGFSFGVGRYFGYANSTKYYWTKLTEKLALFW